MGIPNRQSGFSLVELLIVIGIIGIMSSVVIAAITRTKASAHDSALVKQLQQIDNALNLYLVDHPEGFPNRQYNSYDSNVFDFLVQGRYLNASPYYPGYDYVGNNGQTYNTAWWAGAMDIQPNGNGKAFWVEQYFEKDNGVCLDGRAAGVNVTGCPNSPWPGEATEYGGPGHHCHLILPFDAVLSCQNPA